MSNINPRSIQLRPTAAPRAAGSPAITATAPGRGFEPAPGYSPPETIGFSMTRFGGNGDDPVERLPVAAAAKFRQLVQDATDAITLSRAASDQRRETLEAKLDAGRTLERHQAAVARYMGAARKPDGEVDFAADEQWRTLKAKADRAAAKDERLAALSNDRAALFQTKKGLAASLERWIERHGPEATFAPVETKPATIRKGESVATVVEQIRADIAARKVEAEKLRNAPASKGEARAAAERYVERTIAEGKPNLVDIAAPGVNSRVTWPTRMADVMAFVTRDGGGTVPDPAPPRVRSVDPVALVAWLHPDTFRARILAELDAQFSDDQLDAKAKAARLADLAGETLELERIEEATVVEAEAAGIEILRRTDAAPEAVLQVTTR